MFVVLLIAGFFLGLGYLMRASKLAQVSLLGVLFAAVLAIQLTLPQGHPLRDATGSSPADWAILLGFAVLVGLYVLLLRWLKSRARPAAEPTQEGPFSSTELERYARHIVLHEIGGGGQQKLKAAKVLVIGAGGLGSPCLMYLAAAGVGTIGVVDDDVVSLSNLQRQVLHAEDRIDMAKVFSAEIGLKAINPHVKIRPFNRRLVKDNADSIFDGFDLVLDGSDNFATRHLVNAVCVAKGLPLVSAAISQWEGQISLFDSAKGGPCYACVFPETPSADLLPSCAEIGVMGALPGVVGAMMAVEAIKFITGAGQPLIGEMLIYDALYGENRKLKVARRPDCAVCGDSD